MTRAVRHERTFVRRCESAVTPLLGMSSVLRQGGDHQRAVCGHTPLTRANRYPMRFPMRPEAVANAACHAIEKGLRHRVVPWPMGLVAQILRLGPDAVFDRVVIGLPRKQRR